MTLLEEAIEILTHMPKQNTITVTGKGRKAIQLGNEALQRLEAIRKSDNNECFKCRKPLPSEIYN